MCILSARVKGLYHATEKCPLKDPLQDEWEKRVAHTITQGTWAKRTLKMWAEGAQQLGMTCFAPALPGWQEVYFSSTPSRVSLCLAQVHGRQCWAICHRVLAAALWPLLWQEKTPKYYFPLSLLAPWGMVCPPAGIPRRRCYEISMLFLGSLGRQWMGERKPPSFFFVLEVTYCPLLYTA